MISKCERSREGFTSDHLIQDNFRHHQLVNSCNEKKEEERRKRKSERKRRSDDDDNLRRKKRMDFFSSSIGSTTWILILTLSSCTFNSALSLCEIETGENVAIVEIPESWASQTNQSTNPKELPIGGSESEISLSIQSETHRYFKIKGKKLILIRPLDRDEEGISSIYLQISCQDLTTLTKKSVPVLVKVLDVNDNRPIFASSNFTTSVSESASIGSIVFRDLVASDLDSGSNGLVEYFTIPGDKSQTDGYELFEIKLPHQGFVSLKKPIDFESSSLYYLHVKAVDKSIDPSKRQSALTTLTIHVQDADDLDPVFTSKSCPGPASSCIRTEYKAAISSGSPGGIVQTSPEAIYAKDQDALNESIRYTFQSGQPVFYHQYFEIDSWTGIVKQIKPIDRSSVKRFTLTIKAEQSNNPGRSTSASLIIDVLPVDKNPPIISVSSLHGYVNENSPVGTIISGDKDQMIPLKIVVSDLDITDDDIPALYSFELTTNAFKVTPAGILVVNESPLDRDSPNPSTYTFQVIARQMGSSGSGSSNKGASAPITLNVHLNDMNDNAPRLPAFQPIHLQAGDGIRHVFKVQGRDLDEVDRGKLVYSLLHVSNNGKDKFRISSETGHIEVLSKIYAGEQYSLTIQVADTKLFKAQAILDVIVVPGLNAGGPVFGKDNYNLEVSEGVLPSTAILTLKAIDPENDPITYTISSGNINGDFMIGQSSGTIWVANALDREEVSSYNLVIKATDRGGLVGTTNVAIAITDINDENPIFVQETYLFKVDEGKSNSLVGKVTARDADVGENGEVIYSLSDSSNYFYINSESGEIFTKVQLDFESQRVHQLVVTARDKSANARLSTASVTIEVLDIQDELPFFDKSSHEVNVPENLDNYEVITIKATDPDSYEAITYMIKEGNTSLFTIDAASGVIKTKSGLDFETSTTQFLIVGTLENNNQADVRAVTSVKVNVIDVNDNAPRFLSVPMPIRLQDSVSLGTIVTTLAAVDLDSSSPFNQIRYEIAGRGKAPSYFLIDSNTAVISVKDDLRKEPESEYRIVVKARDLGSPSLSSSTTITVYVEHIAIAPPDSAIGFAESRYNVQVEENSPVGSIIRTIPVINKPRGNFPIVCELISGNDQDLFQVIINDQRDCDLVTKGQLDHESMSKFLLTLRLQTIGGVSGVSRLITQLVVNVLDMNDNDPQFVVPQRYSAMTSDKYLAAIAADAPSDTQVIQVQTTDLDSNLNAMVTFDLVPASDPEGRFKIDPKSGILRSSRPMEDLLDWQLPLTVTLVARDNPADVSKSLATKVDVIVNVIEERHRICLVLRDTPSGRVHEMRDQLLQVIQDTTGLIPGLEKAESLKYLRNNTIESDVSGTDVWIHFVEPSSLRILDSSDARIRSTVLESRSQHNLLELLSRSLSVTAERIRLPFPVFTTNVVHGGIQPVSITNDANDLGSALILLSMVIALLGVVCILYQCVSRGRSAKRDAKKLQHLRRMSAMTAASHSSPGSRMYDPIYMKPPIPSPIGHHHLNYKEYETQVLQMSVTLDDDGSLNGTKLSAKNLMSNSNMSNYGLPRSRSTNYTDCPSANSTTTSSSVDSNHLHHISHHQQSTSNSSRNNLMIEDPNADLSSASIHEM